MLAAVLLSAEATYGAATPQGIPPEPTPLEELLAESPSPSDYYRTAIQMWDGVPGLAALRERWEGFAAARPGYAVLAALLAEAEGNPGAAIERLRALPGEYAAWQAARIHAALGDESAAVPLLENLVRQKTSPDLAAQALLALTERDCIRGDFAGALARSRAAWAAQEGGRFRIQVLERHVSLLAESGAEKAFVEEQMADLKSADAERSRTARHVLAAAGEWFTGDKALRDLRSTVLKEGIPMVSSGNDLFGNGRLQTAHRGFRPVGTELLKVAGDPAAPLSLALPAAYEMATRKMWPDSLEAWPLLSRSLAQRPFGLVQSLFPSTAQGVSPHAPLMDDLEKRLPRDVTRRVFSLWRRAWSGKATPADAGELIKIIGEAPTARRYVPGRYSSAAFSASHGWPYPPRLPDDALIWNLSGARWAGYYRHACRLQILLQHSLDSYPESHPSAGMYGWRHWRPELPPDGAEPIMHWAWEQLREMNEDSPARFAEAANQLTGPGDRAVFAAMTQNKSRLAEWCADPVFVKQMRSAAIMHAIDALGYGVSPRDMNDSPAPGAAAGLVMAEELSGRLGLKVADLARVAEVSRIIHPKVMASFAKEPMDENLVAALGRLAFGDAVREIAEKRQIDGIPHPLYGLPVVPSVARFMRLASKWKATSQTAHRLPFVGSPSLLTADQLLGWIAGRPATLPLMEELAKFETKHPVKKRAQRWQELLKECAGAKPEPGTGPGEMYSSRDLLPQQKAALARLAAEEKSSHEWQLVEVALAEKDAEKRKALLEPFRARSPLTLGAWQETEPVQRAQVPPPGPPPAAKTAAEATDILVEAWSDPEGRRALEPAGAIGRLLIDYRPNALGAAVRPFTADADQLEKLVTALMEKHDALAARAAVCLAGYREPNLRKPALAKAVVAFPDDPEILIAHALASSKAPDAKAFFLRGLSALKSIREPGEGQSVQWCGAGYGMIPWRDAEVAEAITAFGTRAETGHLPDDWVRVLQGILTNEQMIRQVKDVPLMVKTLVRYAKPVPLNSGQSEVWLGISKALTAGGHAATASACAASVLSMPRGELFPGGHSDPVWPWMNSAGLTVTSRKVEGWALLKIAAGADPSRLAEQLRQACAAHPGDEQIALASVLARGLAAPLTDENLSFLANMDAAGRHKVVAVASWLLPEAILPPALCLEAWQADAAREFNENRHNGYRSFAQGLMYLEKLERAGAGERVAQLLGLMIECFAEMEWPREYVTVAAEFVRRHGAQKEREALAAAIAAHLERQRRWKTFESNLSQTLYIFAAAPQTLPESVAGMVTTMLEEAAARVRAEEAGEAGLCFVCEAASLYPRWRERVRGVLALRQNDVRWPERAAVWGDLARLMKTLESGLPVPDLKWSLEPGQPNEGTLHWRFRGLVLSSPPPSGREKEQWAPQISNNKWQALANTLGEKFDAIILVEDMSGAGRRVAARVEKMATGGEVKLTGLPDTGRLIIHLYGREAPNAAGETKPVGFNVTPILIDTNIAAKSTNPPPGWQLCGEPASIGAVHSWYVRSRSGSFPPSLHLLLLDEDGHVCAAGSLLDHAARRDDVSVKGPEAVVILQSALTAGLSSTLAREFSLTAAGPPKRLALAFATDDSAETGPPGRITVQELKQDDITPASTNRLEIERVWFATPGLGGSQPILSGNGAFAAWLNGRRLSLVDVSRDSEPVVREMPVPENAIPRGMTGAGARLRLAFAISQDKPEPETLIIDIHPADAVPQPKVFRLPGTIEFAASYTPVASEFTVLSEQGKFRGVITAEGNLLEPRGDRKFEFAQPVSPKSIMCQPGPDGLIPVFDWTPGSLELTFTKEVPAVAASLLANRKWQSDGQRVLLVTDPAKPLTFIPPLHVANFPVQLSDGILAAISGSGVVRLRVPPTPPK